MVYAGNQVTIIPYSSWPLALSPLNVTAQVSNPMLPLNNSSLQFNFIGDNRWTQFVFFMEGINGTPNPPNDISPGPGQVGFYVTQNLVLPQYYIIGNSVLTSYQPQGATEGVVKTVSDFSDNPLLVSDFMSGVYQAQLFINPTSGTASAYLFKAGVPVWTSGTPYTLYDLPKAIQVQMLGQYEEPITFTQGSFQVVYASVQSTVQSGPNAGYTIPPCQLKAVSNVPSFIDSLTNNVYQYNLASGETANLSSVITDISPSAAPKTVLKQVDTIVST